MSAGDSQFYVVFSTPTDSAARAAFATFTQHTLRSLVGDRAYIAVADETWASAARSFPGVLTVQKGSHCGKLAPQLKSALKRPDSSRLNIIARCFSGPGCASAALDLTAAASPCIVYTHYVCLEVHCSSAAAPAAVVTLSQSPGILWLHPKPYLTPRNYAGRSIIGTGVSQTASPIPFSVFSTIALGPSTSIIAVADSGLDRNNCFFCNSNTHCKSDTTTSSGRNVYKYWFIATSSCAFCGRCGTVSKCSQPAQACSNDIDQIGHGTHVCGTIAVGSLTFTSPPTSYQQGNAAGALLFFQDIHNEHSASACLDWGFGAGLSTPTDLCNLFKPAYDAGARVHSNSWDCAVSSLYTPYDCNMYANVLLPYLQTVIHCVHVRR